MVAVDVTRSRPFVSVIILEFVNGFVCIQSAQNLFNFVLYNLLYSLQLMYNKNWQNYFIRYSRVQIAMNVAPHPEIIASVITYQQHT